MYFYNRWYCCELSDRHCCEKRAIDGLPRNINAKDIFGQRLRLRHLIDSNGVFMEDGGVRKTAETVHYGLAGNVVFRSNFSNVTPRRSVSD